MNGVITFTYMGTTTAKHNGTDHQNTLFWDTDRAYVPGGALGLTLPSWDASGNIYDMDIAFGVNSGSTTLSPPSGSGCSGGLLGFAAHFGGVPIVWTIGQQGIGGLPYFNVYNADIQATATHEIGHLLGLNHTLVQNAVMSTIPGATPAFFCNTDQRNLKSDDISGVEFLYPSPHSCPYAGVVLQQSTQMPAQGGIYNLSVEGTVGDSSTVCTVVPSVSWDVGGQGWLSVGPLQFQGTARYGTGGPGTLFTWWNVSITVSPSSSAARTATIRFAPAAFQPGGAEFETSPTVQISQASAIAPGGTVAVYATLDGSAWSGSVNYTFTCAGQLASGTAAPQTFSSEPVGVCTIATNPSGGPPNGTLVGISHYVSQTLAAGQTITFTLLFASNPPTAGFLMSSDTQSATESQTLSLSVTSGSSANVAFDGTGRSSAVNGASITGWLWTLDGSVAANTSSFSRSLAAGTHTVSLVVTDSRGAQSQAATGTVVVAVPQAQWLSFTEGNPGIPGDGVVINGGLFGYTFDLATPFSLASATNGFTGAAFVPLGVTATSMSYSVKVLRPAPCTGVFGISAAVTGTVTINGVVGAVNDEPQASIQQLVEFANQTLPACSITQNDLAITQLFVYSGVAQPMTKLDAASLGLGQNNIP